MSTTDRSESINSDNAEICKADFALANTSKAGCHGEPIGVAGLTKQELLDVLHHVTDMSTTAVRNADVRLSEDEETKYRLLLLRQQYYKLLSMHYFNPDEWKDEVSSTDIINQLLESGCPQEIIDSNQDDLPGLLGHCLSGGIIERLLELGCLQETINLNRNHLPELLRFCLHFNHDKLFCWKVNQIFNL
jgi:hypothetical protein